MNIRIFKAWRWRSVNRPRFNAERWGGKRFGIWVDWGNGSSDPVWTLGLEISFGKEGATE